MDVSFKAVIEVLGKPRQHVESSIKKYVENLKEEKLFEVTKEKFAEIKKQEEQDLWSAFAEIEVKTDKIENLVHFCFQYMPAMVEIISPTKFTFSDGDFTNFLNDLQSKLHSVDMVAKTMKMENDALKKTGGTLLKNYITVLLSRENMDAQQLSGLTGVDQDRLEDFLDQLIDEGKIDLKEGIYYVPQKAVPSG